MQTTTRKDLYKQVWTKPMSRLSRQYGLSDVGLAKICKKNNIPRPPRGYWARIQSGQKIDKTPLPERKKDWTIKIYGQPNDMVQPNKADVIFKELCHAGLLRNIIVQEVLVNPHPLVEQSAKILKLCGSDAVGIVIPPKQDCLDIRVSKASIPRALRIMDALLKALQGMGYDVSMSEHGTEVKILDVVSHIGIKEELVRRRLRAQDHNLNGYYEFGYKLYEQKPAPSRRLTLQIVDSRPYGTKQFQKQKRRDTETNRLEDTLKHFIAGLLRAAAFHKAKTLSEQQGSNETV